MAHETYHIAGRVIDRQTKAGVAQLRVEAWDKELIFRDLVASAVTNDQGAFQMQFEKSWCDEIFRGRHLELFFKVFRDDALIESTEHSILWKVGEWKLEECRDVEIVIEVDIPPQTGPDSGPFIVQGQVIQLEGNVLAGVTVRAFDQDLRSEEPLGGSVTDKAGNYKITYTAEQFRRVEKDSADLIVRILNADGTLLAASPTFFNAPAVATVDVVVSASAAGLPSEYERLLKELEPLLAEISVNGIAKPTLIDKLADLKSEDIDFLNGETGIERQRIEFLTNAAMLEKQAHAESFELPAAIFYGLFQNGLAQELPLLLNAGEALWRLALQNALDNNLIPALLENQFEQIIAHLISLARMIALQLPAANQSATLGSVLITAGIPASVQSSFIDAYFQHQGTPEEFWAVLANNPQFSDPELRQRLQQAVQLTALTLNHPPLVAALQGTISRPSDIVNLDAIAWRALIDQKTVGVPPEIPGESDEARKQRYTQLLLRVAEDAFPTAKIALTLKESLMLPDVVRYIGEHADFDLITTRIADFVAAHPPTNSNAETLVSDLNRLQRLQRVTQQASQVQPLVSLGFTSALSIARLSPDVFASRVVNVMPRTAALAVYTSATTVASVGHVVMAKLGGAYNLPKLAVTPAASDTVKDYPSLETLFGPMPLCNCPDCQSVTSPAAYLVDLFHFIWVNNSDALKELHHRRPELPDLQLTCDNTLTPLPYIDLVNEVLENAVLGQSPPKTNQTTWTAEELAANPQFIEPKAYDLLRDDKTVYPWNLPFDFWTEEACVYLKHLGVERLQIMEQLQSPTNGPSAEQIAQEFLEITQHEWDVIGTAANSNTELQVYWGTPTLANLSQIDVFLQHSGLSAVDLPNLFNTLFINPVAVPESKRVGIRADKTCDPASKDSAITNLDLDIAALDRIHRFVRLWRLIGLSMGELDQAVAIFGAGQLDSKTLLHVVQFERFRRQISLPVVELLTWWSLIDIHGVPWSPIDSNGVPGLNSLFAQLFFNKAVANPDESKSPDTSFTLNVAGTELLIWENAPANAKPLLKDYLARALAGIQLSAADAGTILDLATAEFKLETLSLLYRTGSLCRALGITASDLAILRSFILANPFETNLDQAIIGAQTFVNDARALLDSPFGLAELDYLLHDETHPDAGIGFSDDAVKVIVDELRTGLKTAAAELATASADPNVPGVVKQKLAVLLPPTQLPLAVGILEAAPGAVLTDADKYFGFLDPTSLNALKQAPPDHQSVTINARYFLVRDPLLQMLAQRARQALVRKKISESFGLSLPVAVELLGKPFVAPPPAPANSAPIDVLLADLMTGTTPTDPGAFPEQFALLHLLYKQAFIASRLKLTEKELDFAVQHVDKLLWLDFRKLPINGPSAAIGFTAIGGLLDYVRLRKQQPAGAAPLYDVFIHAIGGTDTLDELLSELADRTGWDLPQPDPSSTTGQRISPDLHALAVTLDLSAANFVNQTPLVKLAAGVSLVRRIGLAAAQVVTWKQPINDVLAADIRNAAKSKHNANEWLVIAKPLRDVLREKQRDALVSYVLGNGIPYQGTTRFFADTNELFGFLLVDSEMSACQFTSRIKQAIGATQLFVQRCLMNLESGLNLGLVAARQWIWMRNYRIWQANREVFLYPENWIEPTLRDDKTPFFVDLENNLNKNDITDTTAEDAYRQYLEQLEEVARLKVVGMYNETDAFDDPNGEGSDPDVTTIIHFIARTYGVPHIYFYRRLEQGHRWTPWEKISIDITGDHVIPVVWNRKLHLFWAIISEKADQPTGSMTVPTAGSQSTPQQPQRHREIQLAWSVYKNGKWLAKKTSRNNLRKNEPDYWDRSRPIDQLPEDDRNRGLVFKAEMEPNRDGLRIRCIARYYKEASSGDPCAKFQEQVDGVDADIQSLQELLIGASGPTKSDILKKIAAELKILSLAERNLASCRKSHPQLSSFTFPPGGGQWLWETGYFEFSACSSEPRVFDFSPVNTTYAEPRDAAVDHMGFRGDPDPFGDRSGALSLMYPLDKRTLMAPPEQLEFLKMKSAHTDLMALGSSLGNDFWLLYPHRVGQFFFTPFCFADDQRAFYVRHPKKPPLQLYKPTAYLPETISSLVVKYLTLPLTDSSLNVNEAVTNQPSAMSELATSSSAVIVSPPPPYYPPRDLYQFLTFYHPYVCRFIEKLARYGIDGFLRWDEPFTKPDPVQLYKEDYFAFDYLPNTQYVDQPYPIDEVAFEYCDAYAQYNWELFFHAPLLIATRLSRNQRFEEAQRWFHFIFDPTTDKSPLPSPACYWKVKPFQDEGQGISIVDLLMLLSEGGNLQSSDNCDLETLAQRVMEWRNNPFDPFLVARERISAFQKAVVIKYLDNLIAWGDQLFRRETIEQINQATQLYILASEILGPRPEGVPKPDQAINYTWNDLIKDPSALDPLSNELENKLPSLPPSMSNYRFPFTQSPQLVFCIPPNTKLMTYWDTVADRLFKIRHCLNIEGIARQLPLFEPPIEPGLLVQLAAAGVDLSTALNDVQAAIPHYRFTVMLQKANELCGDLRTLGSSLQASLEKRDAEDLALLRSNQEITLLNAVRQIKQMQIDEAQYQLDAITAGRAAIDTRQQFYASRTLTNDAEVAYLTLSTVAGVLQTIASGLQTGASIASYSPNFHWGLAGIGGSPLAYMDYGGQQVSRGISEAAQSLTTIATGLNVGASLASTLALYQRRKDDWDMQAKATGYERDQADKQIAGFNVRLAVAQKDLDNQDLQIENAQGVDDFIRQKYTNRDLFDWMVGQVSAIYFQTYQLTFDLARRAERAYRHELGIYDENAFIQFGYWDNLKQGLLAGERIQGDLRRLEAAYLDQNAREFEITKHVSLMLTDPIALEAFKTNGLCFIDLSEELFDLDYPGHYLRRIKSISVTIPCVIGPYTTVGCSLALTAHRVRYLLLDNDKDPKKYPWNPNDKRFQESYGQVEQIVTSNAQNDAGLFETNLRDERYLPFEGAGAISSWKLQMVKEWQQFDWATISDVIIHVRYTARDGGTNLQTGAIAHLGDVLSKGVRLLSGRHDMPNGWYLFLHPAIDEDHALELPLCVEIFPFLLRSKTIRITNFIAQILWNGDQSAKLNLRLLAPPNQPPAPANPPSSWSGEIAATSLGNSTDDQALAKKTGEEGLDLSSMLVFESSFPQLDGVWYLHATDADVQALPLELRIDVTENGVTRTRLNPDVVNDVLILLSYKAN